MLTLDERFLRRDVDDHIARGLQTVEDFFARDREMLGVCYLFCCLAKFFRRLILDALM